MHVLLLHKKPRLFPGDSITICSLCIKILAIENSNFMVKIQIYVKPGLLEICSQTSNSIPDFFTPPQDCNKPIKTICNNSRLVRPYLPMGAYTPHQTILHPSEPIYADFCQTPQNMMSGEISPVIEPKFCPLTP